MASGAKQEDNGTNRSCPRSSLFGILSHSMLHTLLRLFTPCFARPTAARLIFMQGCLVCCFLAGQAAGWFQNPTKSKAEDVDPARVAEFEREVRPIFIEYCVSCHGSKKQEMGLRLDSAAGLRKGSDDGAVIFAGDPERSPLIEAVRYSGDHQMPPQGKLSPPIIESLEKWVKQGAVWPEELVPSTAPPDLYAASRSHWAFQPISSPPVPEVRDTTQTLSAVERFLQFERDKFGLKRSPPANRRTWLRRVTFDFHGLPPTPQELTDFENDPSEQAFSRVVDRLLQSPRYGERWGRYWLDVARYSDTKGYVRLNENPRFPSSWTYRDYVVQAFNNDLPFDQFILEQLAADLLIRDEHSTVEGRGSLAALGFLTLGQRFLNSQPDIIDDRIDVVTRGLLGMTVGCARCHDHKFDPISTLDYYGLYGVFANSIEPRQPPLILPASRQGEYNAYLSELKARTDKLEDYLRSQQAALTKSMCERVGEYLLAGQFDPIQPNFLAVMFLIDAKKDLNPVMVQRWARYLERSRRHHDPVLAPWNQLATWVLQRQRERSSGPTDEQTIEISAAEFAEQAKRTITMWKTKEVTAPRINAVVIAALERSQLRSLNDVSNVYGSLFKESLDKWENERISSPAATHLADPNWEELRQMMMGDESPLTISMDEVEDFLFVDATTQQQLHAQQRQVTDWIGDPTAAPHAMALQDAEKPTETRVFIRGNASNLGDLATRQLPAILRRDGDRPFQLGSGRLELAESIANANNPLTARVIVNRIWMHHFGTALVGTTSDFGLRGEPPTHPELLDYLASEFMANNWSIKWLHRQMVLSESYLSASEASSADKEFAWTIDPENKLLWRMNRRRLDWEAMRDSLLMVSGQLDDKLGGPSVDLFGPVSSLRRSIYGLIDRQNLASELKVFDFAPPDASSPQRHQTTVPQQALFLMNSSFMKQTVRALGRRIELLVPKAPKHLQIETAYELLFGRKPKQDEVELARAYLKQATSTKNGSLVDAEMEFLTPWEEYLQVLLLSNEFLFID
jgi:mono/diheme cytochrome c family protein